MITEDQTELFVWVAVARDSTMEVMRPEKRENDPERWKNMGGADRGKTVYMQKARLCVGHT